MGAAVKGTVFIAGLAVAGALSVALHAAQDGASWQRIRQPKPVFSPVDQGVADRTQLSASQRVPFRDLRLPTNFDREYRVDSAYRPYGGLRSHTGFYARASGGIVALYPQPLYKGVARGVEQIGIPAGTVYLFADSAKLTGHSVVKYQTQPQQSSLLQRLDAANPPTSHASAVAALNEPMARQASIVDRMAPRTETGATELASDGTLFRKRSDESQAGANSPTAATTARPSSSAESFDQKASATNSQSIWSNESIRQARIGVLLTSALGNSPG